MKFYFFSFLLLIISCHKKDKLYFDWQEKYIKKEKYKITKIENFYEYKSSKFTLIDKDSTEFYYDINNNLISKDNTLFYTYKDNKIVQEEFCTRTCESPFTIVYTYNNENLLIEKRHQNLKFIIEKNKYDDNQNLVEKKLGKNTLGKIFLFFYDSKNRLITKKEKEYNTNLNKWLNYTETYFYNKKNLINKIIRKSENEDITITTEYFYNHNNQLTTEIYKTKTSMPGYKLDPKEKTIHSAYYGKIVYKFNTKNQLIEKTDYQPDYKTPVYKTIYSHKKIICK